jgi:hypothetical protein
MSTPPGPLSGPPPYDAPQPGEPATPAKPPPSWWWFVGPLALLVVSGVLFAGMLIWTVSDVTQVDARVPVDGEAHTVQVPTEGDRMLFADTTADRRPCVITDADGDIIEQRDVFGDFTMTRDGREWSGLTRFDPGDGNVTIACPAGPASAPGEVLVTPAHDIVGLVVRILGTILVPMLLGGAGLLWAIILGIVILTRRTAA